MLMAIKRDKIESTGHVEIAADVGVWADPHKQ